VSSALLLLWWPGSWTTPDFRKRASTRSGWHARASGTLGQTAHCQIAVSLHRTDARGSSPLGLRLYLPQEWTDDPARCRAAGIPDTVGFRPHWQLAVELIDQALAWGLPPPPAVLADSAYGEVTAFREALEARQLAYAVGISKALAVWPESPGGAVPNGTGRGRPRKCMRFGGQKPVSVQELALAHRKRFRTVTWREGSHGLLTSRFWAQRVESAHDWNHGQATGEGGLALGGVASRRAGAGPILLV
jgi:SRSO17 transposase